MTLTPEALEEIKARLEGDLPAIRYPRHPGEVMGVSCQHFSALVKDRGNLIKALEEKDAEIERLREALTKVRRGPLRPLPDPGGHSWRVFGEAAFQGLRDGQRIATKALASLPANIVGSSEDRAAMDGGA